MTYPLSSDQPKPSVLVLGFRRPHLLRKTLEVVRAAGPMSVYVSIDGPRNDTPDDGPLVEECVEVAQSFDWPCPSRLLLTDSNGGVGRGVVRGIDWFFEHEASGIVIEDDVLIAPESLVLAGLLLKRFESCRQVGSISLFNPVPASRLAVPSNGIRLSRLPSSQYWGTWRDRWAQIPGPDSDLLELVPADYLRRIGGRRFPSEWRRAIEQSSREGSISWEHRWMTAHWRSDWTAVTTTANYSTHMGFGPDATSSFERPSWYPLRPDEWDGVPEIWSPRLDKVADTWLFNQRFGLSVGKKTKRKVAATFPWLKKAWRRVTESLTSVSTRRARASGGGEMES